MRPVLKKGLPPLPATLLDIFSDTDENGEDNTLDKKSSPATPQDERDSKDDGERDQGSREQGPPPLEVDMEIERNTVGVDKTSRP